MASKCTRKPSSTQSRSLLSCLDSISIDIGKSYSNVITTADEWEGECNMKHEANKGEGSVLMRTQIKTKKAAKSYGKREWLSRT